MNETHFAGNQTGGNHYQKFPIQPWEFNIRNKLPWGEGEIIKYVCRWQDKGGVEDLKKARDILDRLIQEARPVVVVKNKPLMDYTLTETEHQGID